MSRDTKSPRWTTAHGRLREVERVARAMPELGAGDLRCLGAVLQAIDVRTGEVEMIDDELGARCGDLSRTSLWRQRNALQAAGVIGFDPGRPKQPTRYFVIISDERLMEELAALDQRIAEAHGRVAKDQGRRIGVAELRRKKASEHIVAETPASQTCNASTSQNCDTYLPPISHEESSPESKETYDLTRKGLSVEEQGIGDTGNEASQRQASPHRSMNESPRFNEDAARALAAFLADRRTLRIVGQGDPAEVISRFAFLTHGQLAEIARRWRFGVKPRGHCAFSEARALADDVRFRLDRLLKGSRAGFGAFRLLSHLADGEREGLLAAVADGADATDTRIAQAIEVGVHRDAEARRLFDRRQAEQRAQELAPKERARREAIKSKFMAIEAKVASRGGVSLADIHRRLGEGDEARGRRLAEALGPAHIARLGQVADGSSLQSGSAFDDAHALAVRLLKKSEEARDAQKA